MSETGVVVVIQARIGSTRLRGKVLLDVAGDTILGHVIRRVQSARGVDKVVLATTVDAEDDCLVPVARSRGAAVTRGPRDDVLGRFAQAFAEHGGDIGVRVTADCPLLDPALLDQGLELFRRDAGRPDYLSNTVDRSYPRGYDFEVFRVESLLDAAANARDAYAREHVTPCLYRHPERFNLRVLRRDDPRGTASWRLTLDTTDDWRLIRHVFEVLAPRNRLFGLAEVEAYLAANPGLLEWNRNVVQKP